MTNMHLTILAGFALYASLCVTSSPLNSLCSQGHKGILFHIRDSKNLTAGCKVTAILRKNCLSLLRGNENYKKINLESIETPIHVVPNDEKCLSIKHSKEKADIICCGTQSCRDEWWFALTKQILCAHQGGMRNEIAGEPSAEVEQREVLEDVIEKPEDGGITIHVDRGQMATEPILSIHPRFLGLKGNITRS